MSIRILKRPSDTPIRIKGPIVNSFCNGELHITEEDKVFFRKARKLTEVKKQTKTDKNGDGK